MDTSTSPVVVDAPVLDRFAPARQAHMEAAAVRALDDPKAVARAARIVRAALERGKLDMLDVLPRNAT